MIIAVTATRKGMTEEQRHEVDEIVALYLAWAEHHVGEETHFIHGACEGGDEDFVNIVDTARNAGGRGIIIEAYPGHLPQWTSRRAIALSDIVHGTANTIVRNHHMADRADILIACPSGRKEVRRSGTWATIRYRRKTGRGMTIVYPDGSTERH